MFEHKVGLTAGPLSTLPYLFLVGDLGVIYISCGGLGAFLLNLLLLLVWSSKDSSNNPSSSSPMACCGSLTSLSHIRTTSPMHLKIGCVVGISTTTAAPAVGSWILREGMTSYGWAAATLTTLACFLYFLLFLLLEEGSGSKSTSDVSPLARRAALRWSSKAT